MSNPVTAAREAKRIHDIHLHRMALIRNRPRHSAIDDGAPRGLKRGKTHRNMKRLQMEKDRQKEIQKHNHMLFHKMARIMAQGGTLYMSKIKPYTVRSITLDGRKAELERIDLRNQELLHRLKTTMPYYDVAKWEAEHKYQKRFQVLMSRFPDIRLQETMEDDRKQARTLRSTRKRRGRRRRRPDGRGADRDGEGAVMSDGDGGGTDGSDGGEGDDNPDDGGRGAAHETMLSTAPARQQTGGEDGLSGADPPDGTGGNGGDAGSGGGSPDRSRADRGGGTGSGGESGGGSPQQARTQPEPRGAKKAGNRSKRRGGGGRKRAPPSTPPPGAPRHLPTPQTTDLIAGFDHFEQEQFTRNVSRLLRPLPAPAGTLRATVRSESTMGASDSAAAGGTADGEAERYSSPTWRLEPVDLNKWPRGKLRPYKFAQVQTLYGEPSSPTLVAPPSPSFVGPPGPLPWSPPRTADGSLRTRPRSQSPGPGLTGTDPSQAASGSQPPMSPITRSGSSAAGSRGGGSRGQGHSQRGRPVSEDIVTRTVKAAEARARADEEAAGKGTGSRGGSGGSSGSPHASASAGGRDGDAANEARIRAVNADLAHARGDT